MVLHMVFKRLRQNSRDMTAATWTTRRLVWQILFHRALQCL